MYLYDELTVLEEGLTNISVMSGKLPDANKRIKDLVIHFAEGNVTKFVQLLNDDSVSQQKVNRIFNIDTRTQKYPSIPQAVTRAILSRFPEVNSKWLLNGEGGMLISKTVTPAPPGDAMNRERALLRVLLHEVAKLKANASGASLEQVLKELEQNTTLELNDLEGK